MKSTNLPPIVSYCCLLIHYIFEMRVLADNDLTEQPVLPHLDGLEAHQLQQSQKHAQQGVAGVYVAQQLPQPDWPLFKTEPAAQVLDHLTDRDRLLVHLEDGA